MTLPPRDHALIDALEAEQGSEATLRLWRVCRDGRDPTQCSRPGGRWDDGMFEALYTAEDADGAVAEMYFHLRRGQPVIPSKIDYRLHELSLKTTSMLDLSESQKLSALGVDMRRFGRLTYGSHGAEYPISQKIAEVAHFLEFDCLRVPSARWSCANVAVFCDRVPPERLAAVTDHGVIDWNTWISAKQGAISL
jgi:RES domain-containing protein